MIQTLVLLIEEKLAWGNGEEWSNKDFESLSEQIFRDTKKRLSVTTLKRVWGRAELIANPSIATLDILAEFLGYASWREFARTQDNRPSPKPFLRSKKRIKQITILGIALLSALLIRYYLVQSYAQEVAEEKHSLEPSDFGFESKVVSSGLPNSVVFQYNASSALPQSKIEIQQDWDQRKRITIDGNDSIATCIYYRPGFFKSKLVVNGAIVKEDDVFIGTKGWLGTIDKDSIPIYLGAHEIEQTSSVGASVQTLLNYDIDPKVTQITTGLYYVKAFKDLYINDFEADFELKNVTDQSVSGCQEVELFILYDGGAIGIPLAKKGCISNLNLMGFGRYIEGKKNDLSAFGVDFNNSVTLSCAAKEGLFKIYVNGALTYELPTQGLEYAIKGLSVHFEGAGFISKASFTNADGHRYVLQ